MELEHDTQVIVVCNQKGGVGKTTAAANLAGTAAEAYPPIFPDHLSAAKGSASIPSDELLDAYKPPPRWGHFKGSGPHFVIDSARWGALAGTL